jgi:hypothetical protein
MAALDSDRIVGELVRLAPDPQDFPTEQAYSEAVDRWEQAEVLCKRAHEVFGVLAPSVQLTDDSTGIDIPEFGIRLDTVDIGKPTIAGERIVPGLVVLVGVYWAGSYWEPPETDFEPRGVYLSAAEAVVKAILLHEEDVLYGKLQSYAEQQERQFLKGLRPEEA